MVEVLTWTNQDEQASIIERSVQALLSGQLIVLPTDTSYVLACDATQAEAMHSLFDCPRIDAQWPTMAILGMEDLEGWNLPLPPIAQKLLRRCWPGSLTVKLDEMGQKQLVEQFPESVQAFLQSLTVRSPGHYAFLYTIQQFNKPILFVELSDASGPVRDPEIAKGLTKEQASILIADENQQFQSSMPTILELHENSYTTLRAGSPTETQLQSQLINFFLFICTGNTCRSPLAEALCKKLLSEKLNCSLEELQHRGYFVMSAGVAAQDEQPASEESITIAQELGIDLSHHLSQKLNYSLARHADALICMTQSHLHLLLGAFPDVQPRARILNGDGQDLTDPIGQSIEIYRECAKQIQSDLEVLLPELCPE